MAKNLFQSLGCDIWKKEDIGIRDGRGGRDGKGRRGGRDFRGDREHSPFFQNLNISLNYFFIEF